MLLISHVPKSFLIDQWPVSIERFEKYVAMTGIVPNARQKGISMIELARAGDPNADVVNITYTEAESYCQWAGKRLPTFEERQSAAYHYQIQQRFGNPYIDEWIEGGWDVYLRGNPNGPELIRYLQRGPDGFASDLSFRCAKDQ
jgi:formylglycine-generating enzyme required for sulfatase activity